MPQKLNDATPGELKSQSSSIIRESSGKQALNPSERATLLSGHQLSIGEDPVLIGKTYLNIQMKPGATFWNLMSVFFLQFFVMITASDYMVLETPLLENKDYYNQTPQQAIHTQIVEGAISGVPGLIFMFLTGYVYDIFGVKYAIFIGTLFAGASLMLYPLGAPHVWILITGGCLFGIGEDIIGANTLICDFVEVKDRGKALSFSLMGVCLGVILGNQVLIHFTRDLVPLLQWSICSGIMVAFSISMLLTISEPKDRVKQKDQNKPILRKVLDLTINIFKAVLKNPNLLIGWIMEVFVGGPIIILELYLYNWLQAWQPEDGSGPFPDYDSFMNYEEKQSSFGSIIALLLLYFAGSVIDKIDFRIIMPITILFRAGVFYMVYTIQNPVTQPYLFWTFCPMMHVAYYITEVAMKSYLLKIYPKEIRGMCLMMQHISGYVFGAGYPFLLQYFYDKSPNYVFFAVSMIDLGIIVLLLLLYTIGFGKVNLLLDEEDQIDDAPIENQQNQSQGANIEHQTSQMI